MPYLHQEIRTETTEAVPTPTYDLMPTTVIDNSKLNEKDVPETVQVDEVISSPLVRQNAFYIKTKNSIDQLNKPWSSESLESSYEPSRVMKRESYHTYSEKETIFKVPKITIMKKKPAQTEFDISSKRYRTAAITSKKMKKNKNNDWECLYCTRLYSEDIRDDILTKWIECDNCTNDADGEVDFVCEGCTL